MLLNPNRWLASGRTCAEIGLALLLRISIDIALRNARRIIFVLIRLCKDWMDLKEIFLKRCPCQRMLVRMPKWSIFFLNEGLLVDGIVGMMSIERQITNPIILGKMMKFLKVGGYWLQMKLWTPGWRHIMILLWIKSPSTCQRVWQKMSTINLRGMLSAAALPNIMNNVKRIKLGAI